MNRAGAAADRKGALVRVLLSLVLAVAVALVPSTATADVPAGPAAGILGDDEDPTLYWTRLLPPAPVGEPAEAVRRCGPDGSVCLRRVERDLARLADELGCDHRAVFATTYRLLTRELRLAVSGDPTSFDDPAGIGLLAEVFHRMYVQVLDDHAAGRPVPPAWEVAMAAAADGDRSAGQDMLLAINAHVQRDMPFAVAEVGTVAPDGTARKADHDRVNQVLRHAYHRIVPAVAQRYDPGMAPLADQPTRVDGTAATQLVAVWREGVWRNAEHLTVATSPAHRELAASAIERGAEAWAVAMAAPQVPGYRQVRADHCARHGG